MHRPRPAVHGTLSEDPVVALRSLRRQAGQAGRQTLVGRLRVVEAEEKCRHYNVENEEATVQDMELALAALAALWPLEKQK